MSFAEKVVIVTGASSGIGQAAARRFVTEGASVLAVGRDESALASLANEAPAARQRIDCLAIDVTLPDAPSAIVKAAETRFGGIDVVVNAAGIIATGTIETTTDEGWDRMMEINVRAPFRLIRAATPQLIARRGAVVNVSSVNGLRSFPGVLAYCVSKSALDQLTRCAGLELAAKGVRINSVNPGVTVSNLHRRSGFSEEQYSKFLERSKETHPLGRPGQPTDSADMIVFLASEHAGWITGETIAVDGGRHLTCLR